MVFRLEADLVRYDGGLLSTKIQVTQQSVFWNGRNQPRLDE